MIPDDAIRFVTRRFEPADQAEALRLLAVAVLHDGSPAGPRLLRCAVVGSGGSLERLRLQIETLAIDYRDVIVEGEYVPGEQGLVRVRNLNQPIPEDV